MIDEYTKGRIAAFNEVMDIPYYKNILDMYEGASNDAHREGVVWYPRLLSVCEKVAKETNKNIGLVVSIFALIETNSPNQKASFTSTKDSLKRGTAEETPNHKGVSIKSNRPKIDKLIQGADPSSVLTPYQMVYMNNILLPWSNVEARTTQLPMEVAMGKKLTHKEFVKTIGSQTQTDVKRAFLDVAKNISLPVPALEAIVYVEQSKRNYPKIKRLLLPT